MRAASSQTDVRPSALKINRPRHTSRPYVSRIRRHVRFERNLLSRIISFTIGSRAREREIRRFAAAVSERATLRAKVARSAWESQPGFELFFFFYTQGVKMHRWALNSSSEQRSIASGFPWLYVAIFITTWLEKEDEGKRAWSSSSSENATCSDSRGWFNLIEVWFN